MEGIYLTEEKILRLKTDLPPIKKLLDEIQNPNIKAFTKEALEKAPDQWWIDPCSIRMSKDIPNRKFHNPITLTVPGGILNHSIVAVYFALEALIRRPRYQIKKIDIRSLQLPKTEWSNLAISAALLHDLFKNGNPWGEKTHAEHGKLAAEFIQKIPSFKNLPPHQQSLISSGIRWHMGRLSYDYTSKKRFTEFEQVIQEADFYSTRIFLTEVDIQLINYPPKTRI